MAHLDDGSLSIAAVAARHHVSLRYMQRLFEMEGSSYSAFVLSQRLTRAYQLLTSPLHACRLIGAIAYDVGFNDLSCFQSEVPAALRCNAVSCKAPPMITGCEAVVQLAAMMLIPSDSD